MAITYHYVTVAGAGDNSGDSWANAMAASDFFTDAASANADDWYFLEEGTYTLGANQSWTNAGTGAAPIKVIGVVSGTTNEPAVSSDWAYGSDRPLLACGAYTIGDGNYWHFINLRFTGTGTKILGLNGYGLVWNVAMNNSSGTANRVAAQSGTRKFYKNCDLQSASGYAIYANSQTHQVLKNCYIHDSNQGFYNIAGRHAFISGCIFDTITVTGALLDFSATYYISCVENCTFYNCGTGLKIETHYCYFVTSCVFDNCTTGISCDAGYQYWGSVDYCNFSNNGTDRTNIQAGPNDTTSSPGFTNAAGGDFSLTSVSALLGTGIPNRDGV